MLGYLDDLIIVPAGIALVIKMIPGDIMNEHRAVAERSSDRPVSRMAAGFILTLWLLSAGLVVWFVSRYT